MYNTPMRASQAQSRTFLNGLPHGRFCDPISGDRTDRAALSAVSAIAA